MTRKRLIKLLMGHCIPRKLAEAYADLLPYTTNGIKSYAELYTLCAIGNEEQNEQETQP